MTRHRFALALAGLLAITACEASDEGLKRNYCTHVCSCESGLPSLQRQCTEACVVRIGPLEAPPGCIECFLTRTCDDLQTGGGDACDSVCAGPVEDDQQSRTFPAENP